MAVQQDSAKCLTAPPTRAAINIEFQDLTYSVPSGRKDSKVILKEISGNFKSGQLTAILGPSGAGKSTLLNFLAGYKYVGVSGLITVNGEARDMKQFSQISRYIMQEDILQPFLTVEECMLIAAEFKLGSALSSEEKLITITGILNKLNLLKHKNTRTERLSGGERKRLSIGMEMVNNPPVIFLDEPTTGLDDAAGLQCVSLLKTLAQGGRTVVCSIHTPTAKVFALFDHVYILSQGQCVYQGVSSDIVPVLRGIGLPCPTTYNPADFIIDVASGEYGHYTDRLVALTNNGKICCGRSRAIEPEHNLERETIQYDRTFFKNDSLKHGCSGWKQFRIILDRMCRQISRDTFTLVLILMYFLLGFTFDLIYYNIGNDASKALPILSFMFCTMLMHTFCATATPVLNFPMQIQLIKRELFNKWYSLDAHFWASTVLSVPNHFVYSCVFTIMVFGPCGYPMEIEKMAKFVFICVLVALVSETIGLCIATAMNVVNGLFFAQIVISPLLMLTTYGIGFKEIPIIILTLIRVNYIRYGVEGLINAIFENRPQLPCPETSEFCLYTSRKDLMRFYMIENTNYWIDVAVLIAFLVFTKALCLFMLRQRFSPNKAIVGLKLFASFVKTRMMASR